MEIKTNALVKTDNINNLLEKKVEQENNVKNAIDILTTKTALEQKGTIEKLVTEKTEELKNDAEAKRVKSETDRINEETARAIAEKKKIVEEYDKIILAKQKEVEELRTDSDKAQAFFEANSEILKYIGVRSKKSLGIMKALMFVAIPVFCIVQILLFPLTFSGVILETFVNILGGICGAIKNNALKITISILVVLLICAVVFFAYFYGGKLLVNV